MAEEITNIYQLFQKFSWNNSLDINEEKKYIKIVDSEDYILKKERDFFIVVFFDYNQVERKVSRRERYLFLYIHKDLNILDYVNHWASEERNSYGYNFSRDHWIFKKVFEGVNSVKISPNYKKALQKRKDSLLTQPDKFIELQSEMQVISKRSSSSKSSLVNFLVNQAKFDFLSKRTQRTTSTIKGDFDFLIHRFNLTTKKKQKDFLNYLNSSDLNSLGMLFEAMIKKEVFDKTFLRRLDEYFIKEKLRNIIASAKEILSLKSESVTTQNAKILIAKLFSEKIGQLEGVWQKFFDNYLLYLFFSYKKIVPKVELRDLDSSDKQYPDFIGVNHYDGVDIIEIKTHLKSILTWDNRHKNFAFSSEMSKAIIQTINYMDAISDDKIKKTKDKKDLLDYLNIDENLYRPKGIIIISSANKICKNQNRLSREQKIRLKKDFTKLRNSIHNIQIFTFDEILSIGERYIENINSSLVME